MNKVVHSGTIELKRNINATNVIQEVIVNSSKTIHNQIARIRIKTSILLQIALVFCLVREISNMKK